MSNDYIDEMPLNECTILLSLAQLVDFARCCMENVDADGGWSVNDPEKLVADFFKVVLPPRPPEPPRAPTVTRNAFTRAEAEAFDRILRIGEHEMTMAKLVKP